MILNKFLLEEINEDVDSEMVGSSTLGPFDGIYTSSMPNTVLSGSTANGIFCSVPMNSFTTPTSSSFDANSNPISPPYETEHIASTSKMSQQVRRTLENIKTSKAEPIVVQTLRLEGDESLRINNVVATKDGKHMLITLSPQEDTPVIESFANNSKMDVDDESKIALKS